jgi:hypothetical protein
MTVADTIVNALEMAIRTIETLAKERHALALQVITLTNERDEARSALSDMGLGS